MTKELAVTAQPADCAVFEAEWESSQPAVASVDETGFLTAKSEGTTVITLRVGDLTDSFTLEVAAGIPVNDEDFEYSSVTSTGAVAGNVTVEPTSGVSLELVTEGLSPAMSGTALKVTYDTNNWPAISFAGRQFITGLKYTVSFDIKRLVGNTLLYFNLGQTDGKAINFPEDSDEVSFIGVFTVESGKETVCRLFDSGEAGTQGVAKSSYIIDNIRIVEEKTVTLSGVPAGNRVKMGEDFTLGYTTTGDMTGETAVWTSSEEEVATVDNGAVTLVAPGTTVIKVAIGGVEDSFTLTVLPEKYIVVSNAVSAIRVGDTLELAYEYDGIDGSDITVASSGAAIAVEGNTLTAVSVSEGPVTITVSDGKGTEATFDVVVYKTLKTGEEDFNTGAALSELNVPFAIKVSSLVITDDVLPEGGSGKALLAEYNGGYYPGLQADLSDAVTVGKGYTVSFLIKLIDGGKTCYLNFGGGSTPIVFDEAGSTIVFEHTFENIASTKLELFAGSDSATGSFVIDNFSVAEKVEVTITGRPENDILTEGETAQLGYEPSDISGVSWESSVTGVADVDVTGKLTAYSAGKTTIYLLVDGVRSASFELTVRSSVYIELTNITDGAASVSVGDVLEVLYDYNGSGEVTVSAAEDGYVTIEGAEIMAVKAGTVEIVLTDGSAETSFMLTIAPAFETATEDFETGEISGSAFTGGNLSIATRGYGGTRTLSWRTGRSIFLRPVRDARSCSPLR